MESLRSQGFSSRASQGGTHPRLRIADVPPHPILPQTTWGGRIHALHLNYVAGYTNHILFFLELTHNYPVDDQGLLPWCLCCLGGSKDRSASLVRVLRDGKISCVLWSQGLWNPPPPTAKQSNTCFFLKKRRKKKTRRRDNNKQTKETPALFAFDSYLIGILTNLDSSGSIRGTVCYFWRQLVDPLVELGTVTWARQPTQSQQLQL